MQEVPTTLAPIWRGAASLVLASRSESRRALLSAAGLDAEVVAPGVDERALEERHLARGGSLESLAAELACAKALAVSAERLDAYCIGADQTLTFEGRVLHKASDFAEAAQTLATLAGKTHRLTSAFCVARARQALVVHRDHADVRMRVLDPARRACQNRESARLCERRADLLTLKRKESTMLYRNIAEALLYAALAIVQFWRS